MGCTIRLITYKGIAITLPRTPNIEVAWRGRPCVHHRTQQRHSQSVQRSRSRSGPRPRQPLVRQHAPQPARCMPVYAYVGSPRQREVAASRPKDRSECANITPTPGSVVCYESIRCDKNRSGAASTGANTGWYSIPAWEPLWSRATFTMRIKSY